MYNIFETRFCIDIAIPSVRLSVRDTLELYQNGYTYTETVEITSPPDSSIMLAFGQLIAVTKFERRSSLTLTRPKILERYCEILSRSRGKVQDSYNSRPFKSKLVGYVL